MAFVSILHRVNKSPGNLIVRFLPGIQQINNNQSISIMPLSSKPNIPQKLLMGPGPTNLSKRVTDALTWPTLGHLHPEFVQIMDDCKEGIQHALQTTNQYTMVVSGSGHAGMECAFLNLLERGDTVLVLENGIWGQRAANLAESMGITVQRIVADLGCAVPLADVEKALKTHKPKALFVCHGESSTGVLHPLEGLGEACHAQDCLLVVDTVASLCTAPFQCDRLGVDFVYTATQKALSAPTGLSPVSVSERAWKLINNRKTPIPSFYMDVRKLANYWGCTSEPRAYHHTGPIQNIYGLREACAVLKEEGITQSVARHQANTLLLHKGLVKLGLQLFVKDPALRNPAVTTVCVPEGIQFKAVIDYLMNEHKIEIAGGLGPTAGKVWRIGLMGHNSRPENVERVLSALATAMQKVKL